MSWYPLLMMSFGEQTCSAAALLTSHLKCDESLGSGHSFKFLNKTCILLVITSYKVFGYFSELWLIDSTPTPINCAHQKKSKVRKKLPKKQNAIAGRDTVRRAEQFLKLRKWCLLAELCFLCDNWPKPATSQSHAETHNKKDTPPHFFGRCN